MAAGRRAGRLAGVALAALTGCASSGSAGVISYLDEKTAVTVRATTTPWVLARELPELSANSRDYLDLRLLEVDRMGERIDYLSVVAWSTINRWGDVRPPELGRLTLHLDAESVELSPTTPDSEAAGLSQRMLTRRHGQQGSAEYRITSELIRRMARAERVSVALAGDEGALYQAWAPARETFVAFAGEPAGSRRR
jgi:hypothetical protein